MGGGLGFSIKRGLQYQQIDLNLYANGIFMIWAIEVLSKIIVLLMY